MKTNPRWGWALLVLAGALTLSVRAAETATVKSDKVNVRGQALLTSEVITQLQKGETITILEEVEVKKPKKGEPARWLKIQLPANTPVWVYAPYIETTNKTVNVSRVNLRSGPGENFSVLGRIERGTPVKEIRVVSNWMEVEAPAHTYAFVAAEYLERTAPASAPVETALAATPPPSPVQPAVTPPPTQAEAPAPTVVAVQPDQIPVPTVDDKTGAAPSTNAVVESPATAPPPVTATTPAPITATTPAPGSQTAVEISPIRTVSREGKVVVSRSIQAPTEYGLESLQTHRMINYLHSEEAGIKLKVYGGRKVIVTGEELIDVRWTNTPILEVQTIHLVP
jgi:hypothetical protein